MELKDVQTIIDQFENSDIRELKIDEGNFHLYLSKNRLTKQTTEQVPVTNIKPNNAEVKANEPKQTTKPVNLVEKGTPVKAPIVGIVYLQAKPDQPPFVKVGDHINKGDTICIIEAMKMMTEVKSTKTGTVTAINVENEDLIEVDQPLIMVKED